MKWLLLALACFAIPAHAEFLDCLFFDGMDGEVASAPAAWQGNLQLHNCARKTVEPAANPPIPLMHWASDVAATAQAYANQCVYQHSGAPGLGENIFAGAPWGDDETTAAQLWAGEFASYDYASNTCASGAVCGHYTQMVWRSSVEIGCGITNCSVNSPFAGFPQWTFVVCNYRPPGNFVGQRPY
jgi:pathogenesis-related protein 1